MQPLPNPHASLAAAQNPPLAAVLPLLQTQQIQAQSPEASSSPGLPPGQQLLFPATSRSVCDEIGLNWWAALKLHEDDWISFAPDRIGRLNESQEAELRFVGSLVVAGCDRTMLSGLLSGLPRPYAFGVNKLYYHWAARQWRLLPEPGVNPEGNFIEWLESLVEKGDIASLRGILELTQDAVTRLRVRSGQQELRRY